MGSDCLAGSGLFFFSSFRRLYCLVCALFSFSRSRAPGRRGAAEVRAGVRDDLQGSASLVRAPTHSNLTWVRTPSLSIFLLLECYSNLWLLFLDHRSLLNSCFQDSFAVTLACADFVVSNCYLFRPPPTGAALPLCPPAPATRIPGADSR